MAAYGLPEIAGYLPGAVAMQVAGRRLHAVNQPAFGRLLGLPDAHSVLVQRTGRFIDFAGDFLAPFIDPFDDGGAEFACPFGHFHP